MKKGTTFVLILCIMFIYCPVVFASNSASPNSGQMLELSSTQGQAKVDHQSQANKIAIEGVSFEPRSSKSYNMRVCARNTGFPFLDDRQLINVVVYFRLLDDFGNGIPVNISFIESWSEFPNLTAGQSCWTTSIHSIDKASVDAARLIEFTSCEFRYSQNAKGEWKQLKEVFSEPISFEIADIIPVGVDPFTLENVSVEFVDSLPFDITKQTAWRAGLMEGFDYALNNSETYAAIQFSITNMTKQDIILNDLAGNCIIELNFDDGFIYSTNGSKPSFIKSGNNYAVMNNPSQNQSQRIGDEITLSPLVTYDVELFIRCAKAVATQADKSLIVSIRTAQPGYNKVDVVLR